MNAGTNLVQAKHYNQRVVFDAIRLHGPVTRAELARMSGLTAQTISSITSALHDQGLIRLGERRRGRRGQPALEIEVDPEGARMIGLNLDRDHMTLVSVDLAGRIRHRVRHAVDCPTPDQVRVLLGKGIAELSARDEAPDARSLGLGVAFPGRFQPCGTGIHAPPNFQAWHGVDVATVMSDATGMPAWVENNGTAAALGESLYGNGRGLLSFFQFYIGIGVGGGLVMEGHPAAGASRNVGIVSRVPVREGAKRYADGGRLAHAVSVRSLIQGLKDAGTPVRNLDDLTEAHRRQLPALMSWLDVAGEALASSIASIQYLLDPEAIIIGGRLPDTLIDGLLARTRQEAAAWFADQPNPPRILKSALGADATLLGAAALPLHAQLAPSLDTLRLKTSRSQDGATAAAPHVMQ